MEMNSSNGCLPSSHLPNSDRASKAGSRNPGCVNQSARRHYSISTSDLFLSEGMNPLHGFGKLYHCVHLTPKAEPQSRKTQSPKWGEQKLPPKMSEHYPVQNPPRLMVSTRKKVGI